MPADSETTGPDGQSLIAEIVGPFGRVHYRRPPNDPMCEEARGLPGYSVRLVETATVEAARHGR